MNTRKLVMRASPALILVPVVLILITVLTTYFLVVSPRFSGWLRLIRDVHFSPLADILSLT